MSLNRLMLRALAVNALSPQEADADLITMAGDKVFDSRLDPTQFSDDEPELPAIIVYTDEDSWSLVNRASNTGPFIRYVDLRIEIAIGSFDTVVQDEQSFRAFGVPTTDPELEARLDIFEQQVRWALMDWPNRSATAAFKQFVVQFIDISSHVQRDEGGNNRLAMRRMIIRCRINDDCPPSVLVVGQNTSTPQAKVLEEGDFSSVPAWIRPMLVAAQNSPSMMQVVNVLSGTNNVAVLAPLLSRMVVNVENDNREVKLTQMWSV